MPAQIGNLSEIERILRTFFRYLSEQQLSKKSIRNYVSDTRRFLQWVETTGKQPSNASILEEITPSVVEDYKTFLITQATPFSSINRYLASLRQFSAFLHTVHQLSLDIGTISNVSTLPDVGITSRKRALGQFEQALRATHCSSSTIQNYLDDISLFYDFHGTDDVFSVLTKPDVAKFLGFGRQKLLSSATQRRRKASLKRFCAWAKESKYIKDNPFESFPEKVVRAVKNVPLAFFERKPPVQQEEASRGVIHRFYKMYTAWPVSSYLHLSVLVIFTVVLGVFGYRQFFLEAEQKLAFPTSLTAPNRILSFQGRLTDSAGTPITTATNVQFGLYNHITNGAIGDTASVPGPLLWKSGTCSIDPDQDGVFSTLLGSSCGAAIDSFVFTENQNVYLEITVGAETLTPRQQIATVGYALNAETLQGFPASPSAVENTVLIMNNDGDVILGSTSPVFRSTSGTFSIEGNALTLSTNTGTGGNITLSPDGTGQVNFIGGTTSTDFITVNNANLTTGNLISGTVGNNNTGYKFLSFLGGSSPSERFSVTATGAVTATDALTVPVATISATYSGATPLIINGTGGQIFSIANNGNIAATGTLTGLTGLSSSGTVNFSGLSTDGVVYTSGGNGTLNSEATLSSSRGGTGADLSAATQGSIPYFSATGVMSALAPGISGYVLTTQGTEANPVWTSSGSVGTNYWQLNNNVLAPGNTTFDLAVGGNATSSALFQVFGTSGNATTSGTLTFRGAAYTNNVIAARRNAGLQIGDSETGNILFQGGNVGIGTTQPNALLDVNGSLRAAYDADTTSYIGRAAVGYGGGYSDVAYFGHVDLAGAAGNFAIAQASSGSTFVNASTGASIFFRINNGSQAVLTSAGNFGIGTTTAGGRLDVAGNATTSGTLTFRGAAYTNNVIAARANAGLQIGDSETGNILFQGGNVGIGTTQPGTLLQLGTSGSTAGTFSLAGGTSGLVTLQTAAAAGTWTMTLPTSGGSNNFVLTTNGSGTTDWSDPNLLITSNTYWQLNGVILSPGNSTFDLAVGGNATSSALFQVFGTSGNATTSGTLTFSDSTYSSNVIAARANAGLQIGDSETGNILFQGGNVGVGTTQPNAQLHVYANVASGSPYDVAILQNAASGAGNSARLLFRSDTIDAGGIDVYRTIFPGTTHNLRFYVNDGSSLTNSMTLSSAGDLSLSAGSAGLAFTGTAGTHQITTGGTTHLALLSGGNVGIGTTSPGALLDIAGNATTSGTLTFRGAAYTNNVIAARANAGLQIGDSETGNILFQGGNVGIGTTQPGTLLQLGTPGTTAGTLSLAGGTSGLVTLQTAAAAGTWTMTLPTSGGSNNFVLSTNGSGVTTWSDPNLLITSNTYWQLNGVILSPGNSTFDLAVGGNATSSALFQVFGTSGNATTSGTLTFRGAAYTNNVIAARRNAGLQIGDSETGNILFQGGNVGIGTTNPLAPLAVGSSLRLYSSTPTGGNGDAGYVFSTSATLPSGSITESSGEILSYAINVPQVGTRDTGTVGGIFRLDTRTGGFSGGAQSFIVYGYPTGGSDAYERLIVSLQDGTTALAPVSGNVGIGTTSPGALLDIAGNATTSGTLTFRGAAYTNNVIAARANAGLQIGDSETGNILFQGGNVGIGTTNPLADIAVRSGLRLSGSTPPSADVFVGAGYEFSTNSNFNLGLYSETSGQVLVYAINTTSIGRDNTYTGGFVNIDVRPTGFASGGQSFNINGWPTTEGTSYARFRVSLEDGTTALAPSGGNVGVGTTSPGALLDIAGNATTSGTLTFRGAAYTNNVIAARANAGLQIGDSETGNILFQGGNVGIGTTNPLYTLDVNGTLRVAGAATFTGNILPSTDDAYDLGSTSLRWQSLHVGPGSVVVHNDNTNTNYVRLDFSGSTARLVTDAATPLQLTTGANPGINIDTAGNVGIGTTASPIALTVTGTASTSGSLVLGGDLMLKETGSDIVDALGIPMISFSQHTAHHLYLVAGTGAGNVGVGSGTPGSKLSVFGGLAVGSTFAASAAPANGVIVEGNVGIGTTVPAERLDVYTETSDQDIWMRVRSQDNATAGIRFQSSTAARNYAIYKEQDADQFVIGGNSGSHFVDFYNSGVITAFNGGNVGIGTSSPSQLLHVSGTNAAVRISGSNVYLQNSLSTHNSFKRGVLGYNVYWEPADNTWTVDSIGANDFAAIVQENNTGLGFYTKSSSASASFKMNTAGTDGFDSYRRMTISAAGNVGIGITAPTSRLYVNDVQSGLGSGTTYGQFINAVRTESSTITADTTSIGLRISLAHRVTENLVIPYHGFGYALNTTAFTDGTNTFNSLRGVNGTAYTASTATANQDSLFGGVFSGYLNSTGNLTTAYGAYNQAYNNNATGTLTNAIGTNTLAMANSSGPVITATALQALTFTNGGSITIARGAYSRIYSNSGGGLISDSYNFVGQCDTGTTCHNFSATSSVPSEETITTRYGYRVANGTGAGNITNQYGIYINSLTKGTTNNFAIYTEASTPSYFGGNVGIGTTAASSQLRVYGNVAGSMSLSLANSGTAGREYRFRSFTNGSAGSLIIEDLSASAALLTFDQSRDAFFPNNIAINTTTVSYRLTIAGTGAVVGFDNAAYLAARNTSGAYESFLWPRWSDNVTYMNYGSGGFNIRNNSSVSTMQMNSSGYVAIGTTPAQKLTVREDASAAIINIALYRNRAASTSEYFLQMWRDVGADNEFLFRTDGIGFSDGGWTTPADYAEYFYTNDTTLDKGQLVTLTQKSPNGMPGTVTGATDMNREKLVGAVSTKPGIWGALGDDATNSAQAYEQDPHYKIIGLLGQVPVQITTRGETVLEGDYITASDIPGLGEKAKTSGKMLGKAIESTQNWTQSSCPSIQSVGTIPWPPDENGTNAGKPCFTLPDGSIVGKILVLVSPGYGQVESDPNNTILTSTGDLDIVSTYVPDNPYAVVNGSTPITQIAAFAEAVIANMRAGLITVKELSADSIVIAGQSLREYIVSVIQSLPQQELISTGLLSPVAEFDRVKSNEIATDLISPLSSTSSGITLSLNTGTNQKISIHDENDNSVSSLDGAGNATFSGTVTSENVQASSISARFAYLDHIQADQIDAKSIRAQQIEGMQAILDRIYGATVSAQQYQAVPETPPSVPDATASALLADISTWTATTSSTFTTDTLTASTGFFKDYLEAGNHISIGDASSSLGVFMADSNSIATTNNTLYIQPTGIGTINLLAGRMLIKDSGDIEINTNVFIAGNLNVQGEISVLGQLLLSPAGTATPSSKLAGLLNITDENGNSVASITASGSAVFKETTLEKLIIAAPSGPGSDVSGEPQNNASAGQATIAAGQTEVSVQNSAVTGYTLIYLTPQSDTQNQVLYVKTKTEGQGFTVAVNAPLPNDVQFTYWLIETKE